jgi:endonuclease IV
MMKKYNIDNFDPLPKTANHINEIELQLKKVVMYWENTYTECDCMQEVLSDLHSILNYIENEKNE